MCDCSGNVAELATANIFMVKDGTVFTPAPNGTFLAGITRARVIKLLRAADIYRGRDDVELCRFSIGRRDIFHPGINQGVTGRAH